MASNMLDIGALLLNTITVSFLPRQAIERRKKRAGVTLFSMAMGVRDLIKTNSLVNFSIRNESLKWISIAWSLHQCLPGLIFVGCALLHFCVAVSRNAFVCLVRAGQ
jgi:hypothetical protein